MAEIEEIIRAARGAVGWQINLVLTPKDIDVLLFELDRLRVIEKAFKQKTAEKVQRDKEAALNGNGHHGI